MMAQQGSAFRLVQKSGFYVGVSGVAIADPKILWYPRFNETEPGDQRKHPYSPDLILHIWSGRQGRESCGVRVPCRQLPDSDD